MLGPTKEVRMGFLDKLLGRGKEAAQDVGDAGKDVGSKAMDATDDVGQKAEDAFGEAKDRVTGDERNERRPRSQPRRFSYSPGSPSAPEPTPRRWRHGRPRALG